MQTTSPINAFGNLVVSNPNAPQGLNATFQITDPISDTLTTDQSVYQLGEPIQMTYTEVNTSDQPVTVSEGPDRRLSASRIMGHWS